MHDSASSMKTTSTERAAATDPLQTTSMVQLAMSSDERSFGKLTHGERIHGSSDTTDSDWR